MINKIKKLLSEQTVGFTKKQKAEFLNHLGFESWKEVESATSKELCALKEKLDNNSLEFKTVNLSGAIYNITQPKGNRDIRKISWSNESVKRSLNKKEQSPVKKVKFEHSFNPDE